MMTFSPIDENLYDEAATQITYCKLFPLIIEDFVSRLDAKQMFLPSNLPFTSQVTTNPGQLISGAGGGPAPVTGATSAPGTGTGVGQVTPPYDGSTEHPSNGALRAKKRAIKDAGGQTAKAVLDTAVGG